MEMSIVSLSLLVVVVEDSLEELMLVVVVDGLHDTVHVSLSLTTYSVLCKCTQSMQTHTHKHKRAVVTLANIKYLFLTDLINK